MADSSSDPRRNAVVAAHDPADPNAHRAPKIRNTKNGKRDLEFIVGRIDHPNGKVSYEAKWIGDDFPTEEDESVFHPEDIAAWTLAEDDARRMGQEDLVDDVIAEIEASRKNQQQTAM